MAKKLSAEVREKLIIQVTDEAINTGASYKVIGEKFGISNATVADYLNNQIAKIDGSKYKLLKEIYDQKNPQNKKNSIETIERIYTAYNLILNGEQINSIAKMLNETPMTIDRDVNNRLKYYSPNRSKIISAVLRYNSLVNLPNFKSDLNIDEIKQFILTNKELMVMVSASAYISNHSLSEIANKYHVTKDDIKATFRELLPVIDDDLSNLVNKKLYEDTLISELETETYRIELVEDKHK